jgi:hypothetical protein
MPAGSAAPFLEAGQSKRVLRVAEGLLHGSARYEPSDNSHGSILSPRWSSCDGPIHEARVAQVALSSNRKPATATNP